MRERIGLAIVILLCISLVIYAGTTLAGKLLGILMFVGIWVAYDNVYKDVFEVKPKCVKML